MKAVKESLVPENKEGKQTDLKYSLILPFDEAVKCFERAHMRMLNPGTWHKLSGIFSACFVLTSANGQKVNRLAQVNDHYKIDIPGPGSKAGGGYDWVTVDAIEDITRTGMSEESCGLRLRPCSDPTGTGKDTAHFFQEQATSTFIIRRKDNTVTASYHGRNELPNVHTGSMFDNVRNTVIASGALSGFSEMQWMILIKAFLQEEIGG